MTRAAVIHRSLLATLVAIIAIAGVLAAQRFRGGTAAEEVARRYLSGVQRGDTVALLWLMMPGREQPDAIGQRISRYRGVANELREIVLLTHANASYVRFVCVSVDGRPFDGVVLEQRADRWYLADLPNESSALCRQASRAPNSRPEVSRTQFLRKAEFPTSSLLRLRLDKRFALTGYHSRRLLGRETRRQQPDIVIKFQAIALVAETKPDTG